MKFSKKVFICFSISSYCIYKTLPKHSWYPLPLHQAKIRGILSNVKYQVHQLWWMSKQTSTRTLACFSVILQCSHFSLPIALHISRVRRIILFFKRARSSNHIDHEMLDKSLFCPKKMSKVRTVRYFLIFGWMGQRCRWLTSGWPVKDRSVYSTLSKLNTKEFVLPLNSDLLRLGLSASVSCLSAPLPFLYP